MNLELYLLIGQSNMAGRGQVGEEDQQPHPRVFALDQSLNWIPATEPIHFDKPAILGVGPGLAFGKAIAEARPDNEIGLIPCAAGGSPIATWTPGGYWYQTDSHPYDDALRRTRHAMEDGMLCGVIWHQGESDSTPERVLFYADRLCALIRSLREAFDNPTLPFVAGTLGDFFVERREEGKQINQILRKLPEQVPHTACVESTGLVHKGDDLHFDTTSARELGHRYAEAMLQLLSG